MLEQLRAGKQGITGLTGQLLRGFRKSEQGQEKASDGQLEPACRLMRQVQNHQRQQSDQTQSNVMGPSKHSSPGTVAGERPAGSKLGIGRDLFKKLKFLQNPARAFGHGAEWIIGDVNRQTGFFRH